MARMAGCGGAAMLLLAVGAGPAGATLDPGAKSALFSFTAGTVVTASDLHLI